MRLNLLINIPAGTEFGLLSPEVVATIEQIQVGQYTPNNLTGTHDYDGRAIIQAQVDVFEDGPTTLAMIEGMFVQFGLDWQVVAAQYPRKMINEGTEEEPVMVPHVIRKVPAGTENFINATYTGDENNLVEVPAVYGAKLSTNFGDNDWVWE